MLLFSYKKLTGIYAKILTATTRNNTNAQWALKKSSQNQLHNFYSPRKLKSMIVLCSVLKSKSIGLISLKTLHHNNNIKYFWQTGHNDINTVRKIYCFILFYFYFIIKKRNSRRIKRKTFIFILTPTVKIMSMME